MSRLEAATSALSEELPSSSLRQTLLVTARRFKSIWFEVGALLV